MTKNNKDYKKTIFEEMHTKMMDDIEKGIQTQLFEFNEDKIS